MEPRKGTLRSRRATLQEAETRSSDGDLKQSVRINPAEHDGISAALPVRASLRSKGASPEAASTTDVVSSMGSLTLSGSDSVEISAVSTIAIRGSLRCKQIVEATSTLTDKDSIIRQTSAAPLPIVSKSSTSEASGSHIGASAVFNSIRGQLDQTRQEMQRRRTVQVCFLVDCTGSMGQWINEVKRRICDIIEPVQREPEFSRSHFHFSFVGYRDVCDGSQKLARSGFHEDPSVIQRYLETVQAFGGGDAPEDVLSGLDAALDQEWISEGTKLLVHIADAPCHGKMFHSFASSEDTEYESTTALPLAEELMGDLAEARVDYYFIRINASTDRMIEQFRKFYEKEGQELKVYSLGDDPSKLLHTVVDSVRTSIRRSRLAK